MHMKELKIHPPPKKKRFFFSKNTFLDLCQLVCHSWYLSASSKRFLACQRLTLRLLLLLIEIQLITFKANSSLWASKKPLREKKIAFSKFPHPTSIAGITPHFTRYQCVTHCPDSWPALVKLSSICLLAPSLDTRASYFTSLINKCSGTWLAIKCCFSVTQPGTISNTPRCFRTFLTRLHVKNQTHALRSPPNLPSVLTG